jgi:hypothetical protein
MSTTTRHSLREKFGSADTHKTPPALIEKWRMEVGMIRLWIIGPGSDAMHPASEAYYSGRIGTDLERQIAQRAIRILDATHRDHNAGAAEIQAALNQAAHQIHHGIPFSRVAPPTPAPATLADAQAVLAAVSEETGIPTSEIIYSVSAGAKESPRQLARAMASAAMRHRFPSMPMTDIDDLLGIPREATRRFVLRHSECYMQRPAYAATFKSILSKLS